MTTFMAIKIHYDHRASLPSHLKYSRPPTREEYDEYLSLYREKGIGGEGFHECLNFSIPDEGPVRIYLPPTCRPDEKRLSEDLVIFSFTYKKDREMPARIVGVHAGARILNRDVAGIKRSDVEQTEGVEPLFFHAEAPAECVTLLNPPLEYDLRDGIYTPSFKQWGYGLRYIEEDHAQNIVDDSLQKAEEQLPRATVSEGLVLQRQIGVLSEIKKRYFLTGQPPPDRPSEAARTRFSLPDKALGNLGEKLVYERELANARNQGVPPNPVEWTSTVVPSSPFDIKTVRKTNDGYREHFLEVKSSRVQDGTHVFVSARQIEFFENNQERANFVFVTLDSNDELKRTRDISLKQLYAEFELVPIKYTLLPR
ncbi:MAG: protein NO VEIN domain-containing protein [Gammaproteobacteria bacterium]